MTAQELLEQFRNLRLSDAEGLSSNLEALSSNPNVLSRDLGALSRDPRSLDKVDAARKHGFGVRCLSTCQAASARKSASLAPHPA